MHQGTQGLVRKAGGFWGDPFSKCLLSAAVCQALGDSTEQNWPKPPLPVWFTVQ